MSPRPLTRGQRAGLAQVNRALAACAPAVDPAAIRAECEESAAGAERNARQYAAEGSALADDQRRYAAKLRYIADAVRDAEQLRERLNTPEIEDFARGVQLEAAHQRGRWDDSRKTDFDWHAVAGYLAAKALLNPPQNDGTTGKAARLHRLVALGALIANWHAATLADGGTDQ